MSEEFIIEKLVFGGQGLARDSLGKVTLLWNVLPGEVVRAQITSRKKNWQEGIAREIIKPSPERLAPHEAHFLSCSPWQILSLKKENEWKEKMAREVFMSIGKIDLPKFEIISDGVDYGYRNKMEFSFALAADGEVSLAFFDRGTKVRQAISGCVLARPEINVAAAEFLVWIKQEKITLRSLKSLIARVNSAGEVLIALFIKDELAFKTWPKFSANVLGWQVYYSTHKSPASVPTKMLKSFGQDYLAENLLGHQLRFGIFSFWQINTPVFSLALQQMGKFLLANSTVLDFYCGVGAISLGLGDQVFAAELVDSNAEGIVWAQKNIELNKKPNFTARCLFAEQAIDSITSDKVLIVDPPRAGLHPDVTNKILEVKPPQVVYLSCDLSTQARDLAALLTVYRLVDFKLYNFFPHTPHVEALAILERLA